ncbi:MULTISPECIES: hypothetical protein [unclassified Streptomyces]|uniref:hypothetical protein n=1 Tax=unclassified Streptomyces TaxID=2593676 RepID=UPI00093F7661|nr:hypothetical protein [Streptomyces sp. CB02400]
MVPVRRTPPPRRLRRPAPRISDLAPQIAAVRHALAGPLLPRPAPGTRPEEDLERAARIIERRFDLGGATHLSIDDSPTTTAVCDALDTVGQTARAGRLRDLLVDSARRFARLGRHLPAHEVSYEQAIVAPLLDLLGDAYALTGDAVFHDAIEERLP